MLKYFSFLVISVALLILPTGRGSGQTGTATPEAVTPEATHQADLSTRTVFLILMENHNWSQIKGSPSAPYINGVLLPMASYAEQYYNPRRIHPSLPNYLWLEAGTNFGIANDL